MSAVGGPLSFLPRISWRVPCTAAWTVRRASAMGFLVSVGYIPQIMTPTVLLPAYIGSPISAGTLPSTEEPEDPESLLALEPVVLIGPAEVGLAGLTVKSRPRSHSASPGGQPNTRAFVVSQLIARHLAHAVAAQTGTDLMRRIPTVAARRQPERCCRRELRSACRGLTRHRQSGLSSVTNLCVAIACATNGGARGSSCNAGLGVP